MASTSAELLALCLAGKPWPKYFIDELIQPEPSRELMRVVVERLSDLFELRLCDVYAELFSEVIARLLPEYSARQLVHRYHQIRKPRKYLLNGDREGAVYVLSRITLGSDVAVTSVLLDAAKKRFPRAPIYFVGPQKSWELFAADPRLQHLPITYGRSATLADRLASKPNLPTNALVIDPDSRLTQLGLLPICPEENYYFFESRAYGGDSTDPLPELTRRWARETFGIEDARPYIAVPPVEFRGITVSLGVGENPAKRLPEPFETELLRLLAQRGQPILIDRGAGGEEAARVDKAAVNLNIEKWDGSFAGFAAHIAGSNLYVGYDSAGAHVASACGVPLISIFTGEASERMFQRWRPTGCVIRARTVADTLAAVEAALRS